MYRLLVVSVVFMFLVGCQAQGGLPANCPTPVEDLVLEEPGTVEEPQEITVGGLPEKSVFEGELVSFPNLRATDPDGDPISYSFSFPLDENGEWQTEKGDAGEYLVKVTASDGRNEIGQQIKVIVIEVNEPPTLEVEDVVVQEGELVFLEPKVTDPDGDAIELTFSGWMNSDRREATFDDAGTYTVTITASDGKEAVSEDISVTIENVNRQPIVVPIRDILVDEGDKLTLLPTATDPDGDEIAFTYESPFDEGGVWETGAGDAGKYRVSVTASDGSAEDTTTFFVVVQKKNLPPTIEGFEDITVDEGDIVVLTPSVTDPNGDALQLTYSGWMTTDTRQTDFDDAGVYDVTLTASDSELSVEQSITVTVLDVNRPPVFGDGAFE